MAVASQGAIPGDALYPVKRAIENTQAGFSVGDDAKGETVLGNASDAPRRGRQARRRRTRPTPKLVTQTLNDFTEQFTEAATRCSTTTSRTATRVRSGRSTSNAEDSMGALAGLDDLIPRASIPPTGGRLPTTHC